MTLKYCNKTKNYLYYFQMNRLKNLFFLGFIILCLPALPTHAQNIHIEIPPRSIALNEPFSITLEAEGEEIVSYTPFPDINGFKKPKNGLSSYHNEATYQGKKKKIYILEQVYHPLREGIMQIPAFEMTVNGKKIKSVGASIKVKPYDKLRGELKEPESKETKEPEKKTLEVQEDAFLAIDINKTEVFVGEGIAVSLSLYVATTNQAPMQYVELNKQVENISKKIKPTNCWEENFNIAEVPDAPRVSLNGKYYFQNKFYEAVFFPLNAQDITFPALELKMLVSRKITRRENPNEFKEGEGEVTFFRSTPKTIQVKPLPEHPLRDRVAVGKFFLQEGIPYRPIKTGEAVSYYFKIVGEGNIATLYEPHLNNSTNQLLIYAPNLQTNITRNQGSVTGSAVFEYSIVPQEAGTHLLRHHFEWVFFNLNTQRYDTLRPTSQLSVSGESYKGAGGYDQKTHPLYKKMNQKIQAITEEQKEQRLWWFNMLVASMVLLLLLSFIRRGKTKSVK